MKLADRFNYLYMLRACWRLADKGERRMFVVIFAIFFISNSFALTEPLIVAQMIRTITLGGDHILSMLIKWSLVWVGITLAFWIFHGSGRLIERRLAYALQKHYTKTLYNTVTHLPWDWHQNNHSGSVINKVNLATFSVFEFADSQYAYVQLVMNVCGSIVVLIYIAPAAGMIMAIALPLLTIVFGKFDVALGAVSRIRATRASEIAAALADYLGNIATVLTLRLQRASSNEVMRRIAGLRDVSFREARVNEAKWFFLSISLRVIQAVALVSFVWRGQAMGAAAMAGIAVAILQYMRSVGSSFQNAGSQFQTLIRSRVNIENAEFISSAKAIIETRPLTTWHTARIENLAFSYQDREHHAHHLDVSLDLARARRIALVGTSGSGKSTLLRLLRGLHTAESGAMIVDGAAYDSIAPLADLSTLVPQDPEIFENTIRYNITCGIAEDEVALNNAIHIAALESVIAELPQGLDTDIRERGVNLSGGQKQRLALARGILAARDSSLILLDEPTSSLDAATEALVFNNILGSMKDACIVASLHRLHLLERFDYVYVMEAGRIVEQGDFAGLVAAGGVLSALWKAQQAERVE